MKFSNQDREDPDLNMTPLIDVVFLLLIFFMVTTTFEQQARLKIDLPQASQEPVRSEQDRLIIAISREGQYFLNNNEVPTNSADALRDAIISLIGDNRDQPVTLRADANVPHKYVVTAMDVLTRLNVVNLSIATTPDDSEGGN